MFSLTLAQLMSSSASNQEPHPSLQGGHLLFVLIQAQENQVLPVPSSCSFGRERNTRHCSLRGCLPLCWKLSCFLEWISKGH